MSSKEVGIVGLGKMGKNIAIQMLSRGYLVVAYNRSREPVNEIAAKGARAAGSVRELVESLMKPRTVWFMLTAGEVTLEAIREAAKYMGAGDTVIDGGNTNYKESVSLGQELNEKGINYLDAGCSGGPSGALNGMCIMVGGRKEAFEAHKGLFKDLSVPNGYMYTGKTGSGHFTKMVHNAIEYGMMESIGEGLELVEDGPYKDIDIAGLCSLWNNGSVIRGYLVELAARALEKDPKLSDVAPYVDDNGEGRWAVQAAIEYGTPFNAISSSLYERFSSRSEKKYGKRVLAALRHEFGGHEVKKE
jgi:6-phosphogluconate dehydrogenase